MGNQVLNESSDLWVSQKGKEGSAYVSVQSDSIWAYGNYPSTWHLAHAATAADTDDGTTIIETSDISAYNHHEISMVAGTGATSVNVLISHDGTNFEATAVMLVDRSAATGPAAQITDIKAVGNYYLDAKVKKLRVVQNGGSISVAYQVRGSSAVI